MKKFPLSHCNMQNIMFDLQVLRLFSPGLDMTSLCGSLLQFYE